MATGFAHDLRNELAVIAGNAQLLLLRVHKVEPEDLARRLALIMEHVERIEASLDQLYAFRHNGSDAQPSYKPGDMISTALNVVQKAHPECEIVMDVPTVDLPELGVEPALLLFLLTEFLHLCVREANGKVELSVARQADCFQVEARNVYREFPGSEFDWLKEVAQSVGITLQRIRDGEVMTRRIIVPLANKTDE
ncbi:MAG: hypothetical protein FJY67_01005 [Calditrichaeota bacterium]|nr:hypothetical protein [Calditrichota bacterium]